MPLSWSCRDLCLVVNGCFWCGWWQVMAWMFPFSCPPQTGYPWIDSRKSLLLLTVSQSSRHSKQRNSKCEYIMAAPYALTAWWKLHSQGLLPSCHSFPQKFTMALYCPGELPCLLPPLFPSQTYIASLYIMSLVLYVTHLSPHSYRNNAYQGCLWVPITLSS